MYYIGTKTQCEYYLNKVNQGEEYNGVTSNWANPKKHPTLNKWAILKCTSPRNYEPDDVMTEVSELDETWSQSLT